MADLEQKAAEVPAWDLADRMRKSLRHASVGVQEMADYLGVSRATVGTWINGRNRPSKPALRVWALRTGVPYAWLADIPEETAVHRTVNFTWRSHPQAGATFARAA